MRYILLAILGLFLTNAKAVNGVYELDGVQKYRFEINFDPGDIIIGANAQGGLQTNQADLEALTGLVQQQILADWPQVEPEVPNDMEITMFIHVPVLQGPTIIISDAGNKAEFNAQAVAENYRTGIALRAGLYEPPPGVHMLQAQVPLQ